MFINLFILIITIAKIIAVVINVSNSILNIIVIKPFIERSRRFIKDVIKLRDIRNEKDIKDDHEKSIS